MQFNAFKFSTPSSENIKVLPLGRKSNVLKISPEHSPGSSLVSDKKSLIWSCHRPSGPPAGKCPTYYSTRVMLHFPVIHRIVYVRIQRDWRVPTYISTNTVKCHHKKGWKKNTQPGRTTSSTITMGKVNSMFLSSDSKEKTGNHSWFLFEFSIKISFNTNLIFVSRVFARC